MGEVLSLEPPRKPSRRRAVLLLAVAVLLLALLVAGLAFLEFSGVSVQSRWAALDADTQVLTAPYSAPVEDVYVSEGMRVSGAAAGPRKRGQPTLDTDACIAVAAKS